MTLIQSLSFVNLILNFEKYSFVIKTAMLVNRAVLDEMIIPTPGFIKAIVELPIADPEPIKISVIIDNTFFLFKFL